MNEKKWPAATRKGFADFKSRTGETGSEYDLFDAYQRDRNRRRDEAVARGGTERKEVAVGRTANIGHAEEVAAKYLELREMPGFKGKFLRLIGRHEKAGDELRELVHFETVGNAEYAAIQEEAGVQEPLSVHNRFDRSIINRELATAVLNHNVVLKDY